MVKRTALITCADQYMGPAIKTKFLALGLDVVAAESGLLSE